MKSWTLLAMIAGLFVLHQDAWQWRQIEPVLLGWVPMEPWPHLGFPVAAAVALAVLVKFAWPKGLPGNPARIPSRPSADTSTRRK
ncbi:MAG: hypothetical protein J0M24_07075 [Verrucomicrobia bacterium]|nr:hypothetical protein [Verrucomicrobiota bacterium]